MTKGHIDNPLPNETFMLDLEVLPLPMNISKTKVSNYHSQVSQVTHRDLLVLTNRVKASAKAGALTPLDVLEAYVTCGSSLDSGSIKFTRRSILT